jgi:hypothetical protein
LSSTATSASVSSCLDRAHEHETRLTRYDRYDLGLAHGHESRLDGFYVTAYGTDKLDGFRWTAYATDTPDGFYLTAYRTEKLDGFHLVADGSG